jgi:phage-related tail fiber protein
MATIDRRGATVSAADPPIGTNPNPDLAIKAPVRVATTGNINLQTIGLGTIDGVTVAAGNRVLVKDQTDATTNGIYNASTGPWTRTIDAANNSQWTQGVMVLVTQGAANQFTTWVMIAANPITLGITNLTWSYKP